MKYIVIEPIKHGFRYYTVGDPIELDQEFGDSLVDAGLLKSGTKSKAKLSTSTSNTTATRSGDQEGATVGDGDAQDGASASKALIGAAAAEDSAAAASQDSTPKANAGSDDASQLGNRDAAQDGASGTDSKGSGAARTEEAAPKSAAKKKPGKK